MATKHPTIPFYFSDEAPNADDAVLTEKEHLEKYHNNGSIRENKGLPSHRTSMKKLLRSWMVCAID